MNYSPLLYLLHTLDWIIVVIVFTAHNELDYSSLYCIYCTQWDGLFSSRVFTQQTGLTRLYFLCICRVTLLYFVSSAPYLPSDSWNGEIALLEFQASVPAKPSTVSSSRIFFSIANGGEGASLHILRFCLKERVLWGPSEKSKADFSIGLDKSPAAFQVFSLNPPLLIQTVWAVSL